MRKLLFVLFAFVGFVAYAGPIASIEYVHNAIKQKWDIDIAYNANLTNPRLAANMKYLLTAVDVANERLNGSATTDYGNGEYATTAAADTIATDTAVAGLIAIEKYRFSADIQANYATMDFHLAAAGTFYIDWGDGTTETIEKSDTTQTTYTHTYAESGTYKFRLGGLATAYATSGTASFKFTVGYESDYRLLGISGCLGCIFPTLADGSQPCFHQTFAHHYLLTGEIPAGLFFGIHGIPGGSMFFYTFTNTGFTSIGSPLFDDLSDGTASSMFFQTFGSCRQLTGPSAQMKLSDGSIKYLYEVYPDATYGQVGACYNGATGLSDYDNIPYDWTYWDI